MIPYQEKVQHYDPLRDCYDEFLGDGPLLARKGIDSAANQALHVYFWMSSAIWCQIFKILV